MSRDAGLPDGPDSAANAHLLSALRAARAGLWQYDVDSDRFTFNDQFYAIFGTTAQMVGGYSMSSVEYVRRFVHPDDAVTVRQAIQGAVTATDSSYSGEMEHRVILADGPVGYIVASWFIVKDAGGRTVRTYGLNQNITERKLSEWRIAEVDSQFKSLVEQQIAGIVIVRLDGNLGYVNPRFAAMLGYDVDDVIGRPLISFIAERDRESIVERTRDRFSGRRSDPPSAFAILRRDGSPLEVLGQSALATWQGRPALVGVVIDNSEHRQAVRAMQQTIEALASTVELRDPYTAGHQRRVRRLACAIGRRIGMSESQIEGLQLASAVHDIGKVLVPTEILTKPGMLTEIEAQLLRQHVEAGYNILKGVEFPWPVAQTVLQHHERLDGSGYPQGLFGDTIPPEAKVLAVADVVDSMMGRRPYREPLGLDAAMHEIESEQGKLYDPAAVNACAASFRQCGFSFDEVGPALVARAGAGRGLPSSSFRVKQVGATV